MSDSPNEQRRPLRLLALDGGGIRCISQLTILEEIMYRIARRTNQDPTTIRPCDYFDLIGGTSTGGIIAVLLARLQMTTTDGLNLCVCLSQDVFGNSLLYTNWTIEKLFHTSFDANRLAEIIRKELEECLPDPSGLTDTEEMRYPEVVKKARAEALLLDPTITSSTETCRAFVCATPGSQPRIGNPLLFRTYERRGDPNGREEEDSSIRNVKIWEALRATSATPGFFARIKIGEETYVDGGLGCNNPAMQVYKEALTYWRHDGRLPEIGCIISLGSGKRKEMKEPSHTEVSGLSGIWNSIVARLNLVDTQLVEIALRLATDCESTHGAMSRMNELEGKYFRFNVENGLKNIYLEDYNRLREVRFYTEEYLKSREIDGELDQVVDKLIRFSSDDPSDWLHA